MLITGGGGGLGRLLAMRMARLKAKVVVWDINEKGKESRFLISFQFVVLQKINNFHQSYYKFYVYFQIFIGQNLLPKQSFYLTTSYL